MAFTDEDTQKVWNKGTTVEGYDAAKFRKDKCSAWITRNQYGNRDSIYGWEIHHLNCNPDDNRFENLVPLQWKNNCITSDNKKLSCPVKSNGDKNYDSST